MIHAFFRKSVEKLGVVSKDKLFILTSCKLYIFCRVEFTLWKVPSQGVSFRLGYEDKPSK